MPRRAARRCFAFQSGNASRRFSVAARRNPGRTDNRSAATRALKNLANGRGIAPIDFSSTQAAAYSTRSRTRGLYGKPRLRASPLKSFSVGVRLSRLDSSAPIRSSAPAEGSVEIPLWGIPLAIGVIGVCLFSGLSALGVVGPDEPRYAAIAEAMARTGDWITPRLWGSPWFEKPVLYYWAAGISMRIFGVSEFAARLPSALAALLALVAVKWAALRCYGIAAAWYAVLLLPTTAAMIGFSRAASPDMLFAGLLTAAMAVALEILQKPRPGALLRIAFGFFLGAAVLAKGPAAVILAGGATLVWAALSRRWLVPLRFLHPLVIAVFCATALPWYVLCARRNPDFLHVFIWQHNFERYLTPVFEHRQPFWFFGIVALLAVGPWTCVVVASGRRLRDRLEWMNTPGLFIACWGLFPIVFFSLSKSKLPGYILPSIPPLILLAGRSLAISLEKQSHSRNIPVAITGTLFIGVAVISTGILPHLGRTFGLGPSTTFTFLILIGSGGLIAVLLSISRRPAIAFLACALLMTGLVAFANAWILPAVDPSISSRSAALESFGLISASRDVAVRGLKRDWQYGLNYYYGRELPEWTPGAPLPEWLFMNETNAIALRKFGDRIHEVSRAGAPYAVLIHVSPENRDSR